jgi:hypothetical protein
LENLFRGAVAKLDWRMSILKDFEISFQGSVAPEVLKKTLKNLGHMQGDQMSL